MLLLVKSASHTGLPWLQLALMLGQSAFEIQKKSPGRFLVKQLLKLQATKPSSVQVMQNVVCHVGESFEQNLVEIMVITADKHAGPLESCMSNFLADWCMQALLHNPFGPICSAASCWGHAQDHIPYTHVLCTT